MKKKLIIYNSLILFVSQIVLILSSIFLISKIGFNNSKENLRTLLNIAIESYDGNNEEEVTNLLVKSKKTIRVTFFTINSEVICDSYDETQQDNRPELSNFGKIYIRYSETYKKNLMYIATSDEGNIIRVAIPVSYINDMINDYRFPLIITSICVFIISFILSYIFSRNNLNKMNGVINKLALVSGTNKIYKGVDSVDTMYEEISDINLEINKKIFELDTEKRKLEYFLNTMDDGLVCIDVNGNIVLINKMARKIFDNSNTDLIFKNYIYLYRDKRLLDFIKNSFIANNEIEYLIKENYYHISSKKITDLWLKDGIILYLTDISNIKKTEKMKRDFFANASHELKSPLTSIIGYQQMIRQGIITDEAKVNEILDNTLKCAKRMNKIIVDMLEISKLESEINVINKDIILRGVILNVITDLHDVAQNMNITIKEEIDDSLVCMNSEYCYNLIKNLVENAIKYNKVNGYVYIKLTNNVLSIRDTGIGISKDDLEHIFERFYRVNKEISRENGGTGLGLSIVKHIITLYGFKISIDSEINKGTNIIVVLK